MTFACAGGGALSFSGDHRPTGEVVNYSKIHVMQYAHSHQSPPVCTF